MISKQFNEIVGRLRVFFARSTEDLFMEYEPLQAEIAATHDPVPWQDRTSLDYRKLSEGECWGHNWDSCWVHVTGRIPERWSDKPVVMRVNLGGEALVFDRDGCPLYGLTNSSIFWSYFVKDVFRFDGVAKGGEAIDYWIEGAANNVQGKMNFPWDPHPVREKHPEGQSDPVVQSLRLALFNEELYHFRIEFSQLCDYLTEFLQSNVEDYRARRLAKLLSDALDAYCGNPANAAAARKLLKPALSAPAQASAMRVTAVGHAHIDVGWLWPVRESIRKAARTYSTQLRLMERYPEYVFGGSQPQLYQFAKDHYPALYRKIKQRIAEGRWECQGGMWVEADDNLSSGEALIRQFLHGKNFFRDEFGVEVRNLWLPDVFGYNGNTPQIMRICGCDFFLTQKISWNNINLFPYNTFRWVGIDGSQVVTHFPPRNNYNSELKASELAVAQDRYKESAICGEFVDLFGIGDGGGGPCEDHIERGRLIRDLEGVPKVAMGPAQPVFDRMIAMQSELPVWHGELYLEKHRGTLTTQARTKKNNRRLEQALVQTEFLCSMLPPAEYPREELDRICKVMLLNQFHDILPGSSIRLVYETTEREHAEALAALAKVREAAAKRLLTLKKESLTLFNSLSCDYRRPVELPSAWATGTVYAADPASGDLRKIATQVEMDGRLFAAVVVPAGGFLTLLRDPALGHAEKTVQDNGKILENSRMRYTFDENAQMVECSPVGARAALLAAPGNVLSLYADEPPEYDAWDVEPSYRSMKIADAAAQCTVSREVGPVRSVLHFRMKIGNSTIDQEASLSADGVAVEFKTVVDWHENRRMLRVAFPTNVRANEATYDIQYGMIRRPTHENTSWDEVKFEVCAHRYADLSDENTGVALMNDCKYGHCIRDGVLDLALLRSPKWPDYTADQGRQEFTYAFRPHEGESFCQPIIAAEAAQLNREPDCFPEMAAPAALAAPARVFGDGVSLEVVKRAEKCDDIILRVVETQGMRATARVILAPGVPAQRVCLSDAIEWEDGEPLETNADGAFEIPLKPFQIATIRIKA